VDRLRHREELVVAGDQLPIGDEAKIAKQRDLRTQDLRDAAAIGRCVDVQDTGAVQRRSQSAR
jgi:hypothetical protein